MSDLKFTATEINMLAHALDQYIEYLLEDIGCYLDFCDSSDKESDLFITTRAEMARLIEQTKDYITLCKHLNIQESIVQSYEINLADYEEEFKQL